MRSGLGTICGYRPTAGPQSSKLVMLRFESGYPLQSFWPLAIKVDVYAVLLRRNELSSIQRLPAIITGVFWRTADSKPAQEVRFCSAGTQSSECGVSQVGRARSCNLRETRFDSATPLHEHNNGDVREQANPAGCEPAFERIDTATSPQLYHLNFITAAGQHDGRAAAL